jgi:hypothetical protein
MRFFILSLLLLSNLAFADQKSRLYKLYNQGKYEAVCQQGFQHFRKNRYDEAFISLYAYGCLNSDSLDRLATPIVMLKYSKDARANASYFSAILMKKKLLYHALLDGYDLSGVKLPASSYILSKVFDLFVANQTKPSDDIYTLKDPIDKTLHYTLYVDKSERIPKMILEEYKNNILIKRHTYW